MGRLLQGGEGVQEWGGAGMSVRLVLVLGVRQLMDELLMARGITPTFVAGYRISDNDVMVAAAEATGAARVQVEAALSRVPPAPPPPPSRAPLPAPLQADVLPGNRRQDAAHRGLRGRSV